MNLCINFLDLDGVSHDPEEFSWAIEENNLLPEKTLSPIPKKIKCLWVCE